MDNYEKNRSKEYTDDLIRQQNLRQADKAWDDKNYLTFIKQIDLIGKDRLPKSYTLKYKMARDKIRGAN
ncbi:MAG TPA: hypothetical protein VGK59_04375 [Ohtaekwangia sp.]